MSKFFKALEQAERERALRDQAPGQDPTPAEVPPPAPTASRDVSPPVGTPVTAEPRTAGPVLDRPRLAEHVRRPKSEPTSELFGAPPEDLDKHLLSLLTPASFEAEQYRGLRHLLEQMHKSTGLSLVAVSSPSVGDGKTTTSINLAGALAQAPEVRVLLVDADLRRPSVADRLALGDAGARGLVDPILDPAVHLEDVVRRRPPFNLSVLPAGRGQTAPYELLKSPRLGELLEEARRQYDYVVLDTPPLIPLLDCRVVGKWVDGFLVVVTAHKTPRTLLEETLRVLDPAKVVGLVFNRDDRPLYGYYGYYSTYYGRPGHVARGWWGQIAQRIGHRPKLF